eukprot:CAMPEP_0170583166 /NCGR_PEP_ID=MMETSP0224-20130122/7982_1 /TAXON_ID=285029 /ORGANISM="Togula jolla, Strain CCCM 725" /LENGTH=572 /DNA_ID=CAMNT_0010906459 /DNA_START=6 /DNA_END=1724 /DNA_ORIENTATION=-
MPLIGLMTTPSTQGTPMPSASESPGFTGLQGRRPIATPSLARFGASTNGPREDNGNGPLSRLAELLSTLRSCLGSGEGMRLLTTVTALRCSLASQTNPPIQEVLDLGAVDLLADLLSNSSSLVRLEAAWVLTNIASGTSAQAAAVASSRCVPLLFEVIVSPGVAERPELCEQCLWVLGNIAGDSDTALRDGLLAAGIMTVLGQLFNMLPSLGWGMTQRTAVLRTLTWLMSSLCRGQPAPPIAEVDPAFDYFAQVLMGAEDAEMLTEAHWGLCYLLEGASGAEDRLRRCRRFLEAGFAAGDVPQPPAEHPVIAQVVRRAQSSSQSEHETSPSASAVRLLGAIVASPGEAAAAAALASGAARALARVMADSQHPSRKDAAWALANSAASGTLAPKIVSDAEVWDAICGAVERGSDVCQECAWIVANVVKSTPALSHLDGTRMIRIMALSLRATPDLALQSALLDACGVLLQHSSDKVVGIMGSGRVHPLATLAHECGLIDELEALQLSEREDVYQKALRLLEAWFGLDSENRPTEKAHQQQQQQVPGSPIRPALRSSSICGLSPLRPSAYQFGA